MLTTCGRKLIGPVRLQGRSHAAIPDVESGVMQVVVSTPSLGPGPKFACEPLSVEGAENADPNDPKSVWTAALESVVPAEWSLWEIALDGASVSRICNLECDLIVQGLARLSREVLVLDISGVLHAMSMPDVPAGLQTMEPLGIQDVNAKGLAMLPDGDLLCAGVASASGPRQVWRLSAEGGDVVSAEVPLQFGALVLKAHEGGVVALSSAYEDVWIEGDLFNEFEACVASDGTFEDVRYLSILGDRKLITLSADGQHAVSPLWTGDILIYDVEAGSHVKIPNFLGEADVRQVVAQAPGGETNGGWLLITDDGVWHLSTAGAATKRLRW